MSLHLLSYKRLNNEYNYSSREPDKTTRNKLIIRILDDQSDSDFPNMKNRDKYVKLRFMLEESLNKLFITIFTAFKVN